MSVISDSILSRTATVDEEIVKPILNSKKIYVTGSRPDISVPMREISCTPTQTKDGLEKNVPITVYDTSGPYTDPNAKIDIRKGLKPLRKQWIDERNDTEQLADPSSPYVLKRLNDPELKRLRYAALPKPRVAKSGKNVSQMHYARKGIVTPEMEFIAIRENQRLSEYRGTSLSQFHYGVPWLSKLPDEVTPEFVRD